MKKRTSVKDLKVRKKDATKVTGGAPYTAADLASDSQRVALLAAASNQTIKAIGDGLSTTAKGV